MDNNLPVAFIGDGVSVNTKASRLLNELYGLPVSEFRCSAHIASGVIKRLATSKTMNVAEVYALYPVIRTIVKHFESSIKSKEILDQCMVVLEMSPLHLMSWCQTRMGHFLKACTTFSLSLPALYDAMATSGIRVEEREQLFTPLSIYELKVLAALEPLFFQSYLRPSDRGDLLVSEAYHLANQLSLKLSEESLDTTDADHFLASLHFDDNGNLLSTVSVGDNDHTMLLNYQSRPRRGGLDNDGILDKIKEDLKGVKTKIVDNIISNINDQMGEDSWFYNWAGMDISRTYTLANRIEMLRPLVKLYTTESIHIVQRYTSTKEDATVPVLFRDRQVHLYYPPKVNCSEEELVESIEKAWPVVNSLWCNERNAARVAKRSPSQLRVWNDFHNQHYSEFPDLCYFLQIMKATSANTSPLERSYTRLEILATKRRNHLLVEHLETQYLLASFKDDLVVREPSKYQYEIERLNGTKEM